MAAATLASQSQLTRLWGSIKLPDWDADRLYALFRRYQAGKLSRAESDEYTRRLMDLIGARLARERAETMLRPCRIDVQDAAQTILITMLRRTRTLKLRHPEPRPLLRNLYDMVHCLLVDQRRRHREQAIPDTDASNDRSDDTVLTSAAGAACWGPSPAAIVDTLRAARDAHIARLGSNVTILRATHTLVSRALVYRGDDLTYDQLPQHLRASLTPNQYAALKLRIRHELASIAG